MNPLEALCLARQHGVTPAALHPLLAVLSDPPMRASRVAEICGVRGATITAHIETLVDRGMITRSDSRKDRRISLLNPTERAFELFGAVIPEIEQFA